MSGDHGSDPLEGYRGREQYHDEVEEAHIRLVHDIPDDEDIEAMRDVIRKEDLIAALNKDSNMRRLVMHCTKELDEQRKVWEQESDPGSVRARAAHLKARACRLVINWVAQIVDTGNVAEGLIEVSEDG